MILPKHPKLMNDAELCDWIKALIERKAPESTFLDYKAEISIKKKTSRVEIGKDISSFANERGGILLYGVPEAEENGVPIPNDLPKCGITIQANMPEGIESILTDIIVPPLPELEIRVLNLEELHPKSLLMIYHPESWNKPHMIEGYKHARYYRRGNFRAIIMKEREIESAYFSRRLSLDHAQEFFKTGDFRPIPDEGSFLRAIICPRFPLIRKKEMLEEQFREWLNANPPNERRGDWVPFLNGWTFRGYPAGAFHGKQYELRLFHNGGFCFNMDLSHPISTENLLNLKGIEKVFNDMILPYSDKAFEILGISGPLTLQVNLYNVNGLNAKIPPPEELWMYSPDVGTTPIETDSLSYIEEMSTSELKVNFDNVCKRIIDRLATAFGLWRG